MNYIKVDYIHSHVSVDCAQPSDKLNLLADEPRIPIKLMEISRVSYPSHQVLSLLEDVNYVIDFFQESSNAPKEITKFGLK